MTIEKHGNKWRITKMYKGVRYHISLDYKPSKKEAELLINEKVNSEDPNANRTDTFLKSAEKYMKIKSNVLSPSTIRGYRTIIKSISDGFGNTKTCDITQELVQKEINDYSAEHSPKSTRNLHGFISAVLSVYKPNMILRTTLPQKVKYEAYTPTENEVKKVLSEVKGTEYEIAYRLGCYGMRRGEICALDPSDLDGNMLNISKSKVLNDKNTWIIKPIPKTTGSQRTIYIDDELAGMIKKQGFAFNDHPNRLNHHLHRLLKRLNIPIFRFHDMRAYYASMAHALGIPDAYIMANGGWTSTNIMNRVYKRTFSDKQAAANMQIAEHLKM